MLGCGEVLGQTQNLRQQSNDYRVWNIFQTIEVSIPDDCYVRNPREQIHSIAELSPPALSLPSSSFCLLSLSLVCCVFAFRAFVAVIFCLAEEFPSLEVFFRTLSVCVFAARFGVRCAGHWRLKGVRFNALWS